MEIQCQIIFIKHRPRKINELDTFGTRERILGTILEGCTAVAVPESVQSCFELSIHFPVFFFRELFLVAVHSRFAIQTNVWKCQNATRCFLAQLHSSVIFCKNPLNSA